MEKKKVIFIVIIILLIIIVAMNFGNRGYGIPDNFDKDLWRYSKEINKKIYHGIKGFEDFKEIKKKDRTTIGDFGKDNYLIKPKEKKEFDDIIKKYQEVIENNKYELDEKELYIYYHTLESIKLYYKVDYLVNDYNISCLESYLGGEAGNWDNELYLSREKIIMTLHSLKLHGAALEKYFKYSYLDMIDNIINRLQEVD